MLTDFKARLENVGRIMVKGRIERYSAFRDDGLAGGNSATEGGSPQQTLGCPEMSYTFLLLTV